MADENVMQWSAAPFVAYDGGDGKGGPPAQVSIRKGVGTIVSLGDASKRSAQVTMQVEGRKFDFKGWVNVDDKVFSIARKHYENNTPVQFRIETQRKQGKDRGIPIHKLQEDDAKSNVKSILVGLGEPGGELTLSREHLTDPKLDVEDGGVAADSDLAVAARTTQRQEMAENGDIESRPWLGTNNDGSINAGSYAINGGIAMYFAVRDRFPEASDEDVASLSEELLSKVDIMQLAVYGFVPGKSGGVLKGHPNRFCNSHALGRKTVEEVLARDHGDVDISDEKVRGKWLNSVAKRALAVWRSSLSGYERFLKRDEK